MPDKKTLYFSFYFYTYTIITLCYERSLGHFYNTQLCTCQYAKYCFPRPKAIAIFQGLDSETLYIFLLLCFLFVSNHKLWKLFEVFLRLDEELTNYAPSTVSQKKCFSFSF